jgi:hypothetical protein
MVTDLTNKIWNFDSPQLNGESYDDDLVTGFVIKFMKKNFNCEFILNPNRKGAFDLINKYNDPRLGFIEVELGYWKGNYWENDYYSYLSGIGERTVNAGMRKGKNFFTLVDNKLIPNEYPHWFIRTNCSQVIIVNSETIKDPEKVIFTSFKVSNNPEIEDWMSFRQKDVLTYDPINDGWELQKK